MNDVQHRPARLDDARRIAAIYNHYVRETVITFEEVPVTDDEMASRIATVLGAGFPWLVATAGEQVVGYAYGGPWKPRSAYRFTTETTVYLAPDHVGQGLGAPLYGALIERLSLLGLHVAIGGIALPNAASVALHEKLGFRPAGRLPEVGFKFGRWIDVGYWQRTLAGGAAAS